MCLTKQCLVIFRGNTIKKYAQSQVKNAQSPRIGKLLVDIMQYSNNKLSSQYKVQANRTIIGLRSPNALNLIVATVYLLHYRPSFDWEQRFSYTA